MNTDGAIKYLAERGYQIHILGKNQYEVRYQGVVWSAPHAYRDRKGHHSSIYTENVWNGRQVVKLAQTRRTPVKANVKHFDKAKNRSATRDAIQTENFDSIPQQGKVKSEDIWAWD